MTDLGDSVAGLVQAHADRPLLHIGKDAHDFGVLERGVGVETLQRNDSGQRNIQKAQQP